MFTDQPITEIIPQRYSCRTYNEQPIKAEKRQQLQAYLKSLHTGPLGTKTRFELLAATEADRQALRGLGTYGFIRGATGFIVGAVQPAQKDMEDFGYMMELAILAATKLGLGTCWLGGSFTKSRFARAMPKNGGSGKEFIPAVTSIGYIPEGNKPANERLRQRLDAERRFPWDKLFFLEDFSHPLTKEDTKSYAEPLEMLRLGPSASNKQPWRVVQIDNAWHFYLRRTPHYGKGSLLFNMLRLADLQRVDIGIAMSHFELTTQELGLQGRWVSDDPGLKKPDLSTEYTITWRAKA